MFFLSFLEVSVSRMPPDKHFEFCLSSFRHVYNPLLSRKRIKRALRLSWSQLVLILTLDLRFSSSPLFGAISLETRCLVSCPMSITCTQTPILHSKQNLSPSFSLIKLALWKTTQRLQRGFPLPLQISHWLEDFPSMMVISPALCFPH